MEILQGFNTSYLVAFIMGLFSSMHCLGMCGSIIGALTLGLRQDIRRSTRALFQYVLSYNLGRISSYTAAGLLVGVLHHVFTLPFNQIDGYRVLQISSALIMGGAGLYIAGWFPRFAYIERIGSKFWRLIEPLGRRLVPIHTMPSSFFFGMVWGWLPCGLVYAALALSATADQIHRSAFTMLFFGLGTLPAVVSVGIMTNLLSRVANNRWLRRFAGIFMIALALFAAFPDLYPLRMYLH
ncbi:MAG: sulfite exporter TauE/SafE family protein [Methylococcaceae bacterium]|nr:sulfite exporter TauE/SafE family protein [Methylococcaceae bacterium]